MCAEGHGHTNMHTSNVDMHMTVCQFHQQTRQLESMVRLAEARARVELRTQVTQQDAEVWGGVCKRGILREGW